jgi:hypothetical protein
MSVKARFSAYVQTGPEAHPASYTMGTGSFPGVKRPGSGVDHHRLLAPRLNKEKRYTFTPPMGLRGLLQGDLYPQHYLGRVLCWRLKTSGITDWYIATDI